MLSQGDSPLQDWAATTRTLIDEGIRCPACMDEEMLSSVTVYWVSHVPRGRVLQCACTEGHEFEEVVEDGS